MKFTPKPEPKPAPPERSGPPAGIQLFFDTRDGSFWFRGVGGVFVNHAKASWQLHFRTTGLRDDVKFNGISELEWPFWNAEFRDAERHINHAGPLAGHQAECSAMSAGGDS